MPAARAGHRSGWPLRRLPAVGRRRQAPAIRRLLREQQPGCRVPAAGGRGGRSQGATACNLVGVGPSRIAVSRLLRGGSMSGADTVDPSHVTRHRTASAGGCACTGSCWRNWNIPRGNNSRSPNCVAGSARVPGTWCPRAGCSSRAALGRGGSRPGGTAGAGSARCGWPDRPWRALPRARTGETLTDVLGIERPAWRTTSSNWAATPSPPCS
jgi:hypothetical protein